MGLQEKLKVEPVTNLNIRTPIAVAPTTTVRKTILKMRDAGLECAVIVGTDRKPAGGFYRGDVAPFAVAVTAVRQPAHLRTHGDDVSMR